MKGFSLRPAGEGRWQLDGQIDFATAPAVWEQLRPLLSTPGNLVVSLAGVRRINSAGLGLFIEGMAVAREARCDLRLVDIPVALQDLAALSNVGQLLSAGLASD